MCTRGHALIRIYQAPSWYLSCIYCPHRLLEGEVQQPVAEVVELSTVIPEEVEPAA